MSVSPPAYRAVAIRSMSARPRVRTAMYAADMKTIVRRPRSGEPRRFHHEASGKPNRQDELGSYSRQDYQNRDEIGRDHPDPPEQCGLHHDSEEDDEGAEAGEPRTGGPDLMTRRLLLDEGVAGEFGRYLLGVGASQARVSDNS